MTDDEGRTLIMVAAQHNATQALKALLADSRAPVDAQHEKVNPQSPGI